MASVTLGPVGASAFRARRFDVWQLRRLGSRYGELPLSALPGTVPATDSAAAPRRPAKPAGRSQGAPLRPDPDYEKRLEELAQDMLGGAAAKAASATPTSGEPPVAESAVKDAVKESGAQPAAATAPEANPLPPAADRGADRGKSTRAGESARSARHNNAARSATSKAASARSRTAPAAPPLPPRIPEADSRGRREPVFEAFETADAFHAVRQRHARRRSRMIAGTLVAGVALGLGSAWWFGKLDQIDSAVAAVNQHASRLVASLERNPGSSSSGGSGSVEVQAASSDALDAAEDAAPASPGSPPQASASKPAPATPADGPVVVTPAPAVVTPAPETASPSAPESVSQPPVASVDARKKSAKDKAREKRGEARARADRHKAPQVAATKPSRKESANAAKHDDDLDRLRSQAYGESSRDREQRMLPKPKPPSSQSAVAVTPISAGGEGRVSYKKELAQCEKIDGIFYQERCKWRICKDKWGSNGCPSYPQQAVRF